MPLLFAVTLFVSASLLFMVQPMVGKMILPLLGGSPAVWNACMVFFQALLLLGYLYAHYVSTRLEPKRQWLVHTVVLLVPLAVMGLAVALGSKHTPIAVSEALAPSGDASPFLAAMALLAVAIGIPFFVASTSAPLIQKWFAYTGHPSARDPYFLYAASNAGSLISLLGYPLVIEPNQTLAAQAWVFAAIFAVLVALIVRCGYAAANPIGVPPIALKADERKAVSSAGGTAAPVNGAPPAAAARTAAPETTRVLKWIALAFVPSSWMLGVTFHMTTDIASIPLLWVVPLALYLVTFIIAFGRVPPWFRLVIGNLAPVMILLLVFTILTGVLNERAALSLLIHIATFFAVALMCHYELALDRPKDVEHLTLYFLMMSVGGVLGGIFNALVAPVLFASVPIALEYYVTIVVGCLMVPKLFESNAGTQSPELVAYKAKIARIFDVAGPVLLGVVFLLLVTSLRRQDWFARFVKWTSSHTPVREHIVVALVIYAVPVMACFFFVDRPLRFALAVAVLLGIDFYRGRDEDIIHTDRSFFGILKVEERGSFTRLVHGTTLHGTQVNDKFRLHPADVTQALPAFTPWDTLLNAGALTSFRPREEPLTYYHRTGPVGAMFYQLRTRNGGQDATAPFAMVGLGTGSVSCYALPGQSLTFYEIDPAVKALVADTDQYFTFVSAARERGAKVEFQMGDARLKLKENVDARYGLLLVDAFSSDAIPVHLCTKEAVQLYMDRLTDNGILALHISNKFVRLEPVVARIADELGLAARVWNDRSDDRYGYKTASSWIVLAKDEKTLGVLAEPATTQAREFGSANPVLIELLNKYGPSASAKDIVKQEWGGEELSIEDFKKLHGKPAGDLVQLVRKYDEAKKELAKGSFSVYAIYREFYPAEVVIDGKPKEAISLGDLTLMEFGQMFHPLKLIPEVRLWTDDYTDVLQVMMLKEVQWLRKQFGYSTPGIED